MSKLKTYNNINPYVINWIINFLSCRQQRVVVDGVVTSYLNINRGVPQGTVLCPILFSLMVNDITFVSPVNVLIKYADDITLSIPVKSTDYSEDLVNLVIANIKHWAQKNKMNKLNIIKTFEMVVKERTKKPLPVTIEGIRRKNELKLLGGTFNEDPCNWDTHFENVLEKGTSNCTF